MWVLYVSPTQTKEKFQLRKRYSAEIKFLAMQT